MVDHGGAPAPAPTSANRATGPATATPKTTSIYGLLRLATPRPAMSGIIRLRYGRQYSSFQATNAA
ncbi:hypothetical protein BZL30_8766 [Mycobacterium kansasii]|uniref:Uncharacterized protein n=1 Tax=Mycobacterium kansasii TaxID=1768 RepID=A0A1V3WH06_MYCKA|nr:hypothetical protein BZL30_8766 [Mycobacterium kansasii]